MSRIPILHIILERYYLSNYHLNINEGKFILVSPLIYMSACGINWMKSEVIAPYPN